MVVWSMARRFHNVTKHRMKRCVLVGVRSAIALEGIGIALADMDLLRCRR